MSTSERTVRSQRKRGGAIVIVIRRCVACALCLGVALLAPRAYAQEETTTTSTPGSNAPRLKEKESAAPRKEERTWGIFYAEAETGVQYTALESLSVKRDVIPRAIRREDVGGMLGAAAGIKLFFLTAGPRVRVGRFEDWDLWTLALDIGWRTPIGAFEPYLRFGGGYARLGRAFDAMLGNRQSVTIQGYCLRLTVGADYFITPAFTVGASFGGEVVGMYRPGIDLSAPNGVLNEAYKLDGTSAGLAMTGTLGLGLHL